VRRRRKISAVLPGRRRRQAQAFFVAIAAAMVAVASATADPSVQEKQAQARQVLEQIDQIDRSLGPAVEAYNFANVKLRQIEGNLQENRRQLKLARSNLKVAQDSLALRLVAAYTSSTPDNSTLAVLLGSTSFEDLLTRIESIDSASQGDAWIVKQVTSF
jgi:peptidoglycan hydrolase CwlO-like protein